MTYTITASTNFGTHRHFNHKSLSWDGREWRTDRQCTGEENFEDGDRAAKEYADADSPWPEMYVKIQLQFLDEDGNAKLIAEREIAPAEVV